MKAPALSYLPRSPLVWCGAGGAFLSAAYQILGPDHDAHSAIGQVFLGLSLIGVGGQNRTLGDLAEDALKHLVALRIGTPPTAPVEPPPATTVVQSDATKPGGLAEQIKPAGDAVMLSCESRVVRLPDGSMHVEVKMEDRWTRLGAVAPAATIDPPAKPTI
jgi:hypothetical protein